MFRCVNLIVILQVALTIPCQAAEGWLCTHTYNTGKEIKSDYVAIGESLIMNKGRGRATILLNNDEEIVAFFSIWVDGYRHRRNGDTVIAESKVSELALMNENFILDKTHNTLITLDNSNQLVVAGLFAPDTYPRSDPSNGPIAEKDNCTRMDQ